MAVLVGSATCAPLGEDIFRLLAMAKVVQATTICLVYQ